MAITRFAVEMFRRLHNSIELRKYTPFTMAEHLRKSGAQVGENCFIVPSDLGTEPYLVRIGNHVAIATGVKFMTHDGAAWLFRGEFPDLHLFGPIVIEDNCCIGYCAVLGPGVRVGPNSVVAAGSVVLTDVPPGTLVMGVPARPFGSLERYRERCLRLWAEQKPPGIAIDAGETWWNSRHFGKNRELLRKHLLTLFREQLSDASVDRPVGV